MAADKYLADVTGQITEKSANQTSAGTGDAGKVVALNSAGQVDFSMLANLLAFAAANG